MPVKLSRPPPGSSPLTRGKPGQATDPRDRCGLIPAHAGKTGARSGPHCAQRAHPRSRGENVLGRDVRLLQSGSSPLTRGKLALDRCRTAPIGLIPAHAGKTFLDLLCFFFRAAHPRSRGENTVGVELNCLTAGSSPLTRGKLLSHKRKSDKVRLIPAHAGKTPVHAKGRRQPAAHPRSRGENCGRRCLSRLAMGSSPLTRGKRPPQCPWRGRCRLIPAHAGKTN